MNFRHLPVVTLQHVSDMLGWGGGGGGGGGNALKGENPR